MDTREKNSGISDSLARLSGLIGYWQAETKPQCPPNADF
ncbi:hypothetical protein FM102_02585 [Corynebacterium glutamicum]|nr:hypothetical protein FM102_02585 [Corynebacterium glutamicum]